MEAMKRSFKKALQFEGFLYGLQTSLFAVIAGVTLGGDFIS
jgi:hypothetical protein